MATARAKKAKAAAVKKSPPKKSAPLRKDVKAPSDTELSAVLGKAWTAWTKIVEAVEDRFAPLERVWFPSKTMPFGKYCRLMRGKRTFLYLLPANGELVVTVGLGERAYQLAMESSLPTGIKKMLTECKPYPEGRFIRMPVTARDAGIVVKLVELKTTPK